MKTHLYLLLGSLFLGLQSQVCAESTPDPKTYRGGWIMQTALPEGIDSEPWKELKFALHISIEIDRNGKVTEATPVEPWVKEMPEWQRPFLERGIEALKKWRFAPLYEGDRNTQAKLINWGMTLHLEFSQNSKGDKNLTIHQGTGKVFIATGTFWRPE